MNAVSLFSGCGGFDLGFMQAGGHIEAAYEIDPKVCEDYERVTGHSPIQADLSRFDFRQLPPAEGFFAGPPCQEFSKGGVGTGAGGVRNMFPQTIQAISIHRPRWFVIENVVGFANDSRHRAYFHSVIADLINLGYTVTHRILNAADYGVPQVRRRVFIVGLRDGKQFTWPEPTNVRVPDVFTPQPWITIREALSDWLREPHEYRSLPPCFQRIRPLVADVIFPEGTKCWRPWRSWDESAFTLRASAKKRGLYMIEGDFSFVTDRRAEAILQTLPPVIQSATAIGNAVPPKLAKAIFQGLGD